LIDWLIWLIDWFDWLIDWFDWLIWLIWLIDWLIDWLTDGSKWVSACSVQLLVMSNSKSWFDLNCSWITYDSFIWLPDDFVCAFMIQLGFDLKLNAIQWENWQIANRGWMKTKHYGLSIYMEACLILHIPIHHFHPCHFRCSSLLHLAQILPVQQILCIIYYWYPPECLYQISVYFSDFLHLFFNCFLAFICF